MGSTTSTGSKPLNSGDIFTSTEVLKSSCDMSIDFEKVKETSIKYYAPIAQRAEKYIKRLQVPVEHLKLMVDVFVHELQEGLEAHKRHPYVWVPDECSFKMVDACVDKLPNGNETGVHYAMDFGGSNFRVIRAELKGSSEIDTKMQDFSLYSFPIGETKKNLLCSTTTAKEIFDAFAFTMKDFIRENNEYDRNDNLTAGFTFSFPCIQRAIDKASLLYWTKEISTGRDTDDPVEGLDILEIMNVAFTRNEVPMQCNVITNDTVATAVCGAYTVDRSKHPQCLVGLILGTGMNCCYYDETAPQYGYQGKMINVECGNFNRNLPRLNVDCELDFKAVESRGFQHIEKMCAAAYLGEICRLVLVRVFAEQTPPKAWQAYTLSTEVLAKIVSDKTEDYSETSQEVKKLWEVEMPMEHLIILHRLATAVMDRSSALAAVLISGCAKKTGRLQPAFSGLSVGIDGSLYKKNPFYQQRLRSYLNAILKPEIGSLIHLITVDDGSGKGAAVLAATN